MMTQTLPSHLSAIRQMVTANVVQDHAVLRYAVSGHLESNSHSICRVVITHTSKNLTVKDFDVTGMSSEAVAKKAALFALEHLLLTSSSEVKLFVAQDDVRSHVESVMDLVPAATLLTSSNDVSNRLDIKAKTLLDVWEENRSSKKNSSRRTVGLPLDNAPSRTVYTDASIGSANAVGVGYIIRDATPSAAHSDDTWWLKFRSGQTSTNASGGSTLAEARAIRMALWGPDVLTDDIKAGERFLTIVSDSRQTLNLIQSMRDDTYKRSAFLKDDETIECARDITDALRAVKDVKLKWVRGHDGDVLNETADSLANWERKRGRGDDLPESYRSDIITNSIKRLQRLGVTSIVD